jgi:hypothetical protein
MSANIEDKRENRVPFLSLLGIPEVGIFSFPAENRQDRLGASGDRYRVLPAAVGIMAVPANSFTGQEG